MSINPSKRSQRFRALLQKASTTMSQTLIPGADFTAAEAEWGYGYNTAKGKNLAQDTQDLDFALITDSVRRTRRGNSVTRDTNPDLTFIKNTEAVTVTCSNTKVDHGCDHAMVHIHVRTPNRMQCSKRTFSRMYLEEFRKQHDRKQLHEAEKIMDIEA
ncbi:hypothetical protein HPB48_021478 [Haemaphysalis longicornis]|uniref:Endonuclease/exonuclease/phosphatase domain-containing protein n=1 Tax=Haemaphysalis longicornis TaxID=44386 RepID=A0A9J6FSD1_HAELO|nr:hypothetical protein HPB48_021478 [Haemaphysalis longicornis]